EKAIILSEHGYDSLGQLIEKDMGVRADGNGKLAELQSVDYRYNLRGWMTDMNQTGSVNVGRGIGDFNEDLFGMKLNYQDGNNPLFNGNISAMKWQVLGKGSAVRSYDFTYDLLSRLTGADFSGGRNNSGGSEEDFSVPQISYDLNGNISTLHRMGKIGRKNGLPVFGMMDELAYTYSGNRLIKLDDKGRENPEGGDQFVDGARKSEEYLYDENGNIIRDLNKKVSYVYNYLNKPTQATFDTGGAIQWVYTADGTKLRQRYIENGKTTNHDYLNAFFYKDGQLQYLSHEEGRALLTQGSFRYEFNLTDHLGNVRVSFSDLDQNGQIEQEELLQEDHYYPFGMRMASLSFQQETENRFRYNGKELHTELGLGLYDYGARMYDPVVGRWNGVDALADFYPSLTPYHYVYNNPLIFVDPLGLEGYRYDWVREVYRDENGKEVSWATVNSYIQKSQLAEKPDAVSFNFEANANLSAPGVSTSSKAGLSLTLFQKGPHKGQWHDYFYIGWDMGVDLPYGAFNLPDVSKMGDTSVQGASLKLKELISAGANLQATIVLSYFNGDDERITPKSFAGFSTESSVSVSAKAGIGISGGGSYYEGIQEDFGLTPGLTLPTPGGVDKGSWYGYSGSGSIGLGSPGVRIGLHTIVYTWLLPEYFLDTFKVLTDPNKVRFKSGRGWYKLKR
ncbi:MAG: RHS repeat-associated core domain-containing protein, partial [Bacteroidota bacterium]